jgi:hypothetical protein
MGKYSLINSIVIQFVQKDLHRLANGDLDLATLYMSDRHEQLALDPMSILRRGIHDLLIDACPRTGNITRIPMLVVNYMTFSWLTDDGVLLNLRNETHLSRALDHPIANHSTVLILQCNTESLFFAPDFTGQDLDRADTTPFPGSSSNANDRPPQYPLSFVEHCWPQSYQRCSSH